MPVYRATPTDGWCDDPADPACNRLVRLLCRSDAHADFGPDQMGQIASMMNRGVRAGLLGHADRLGIPTILWMISDNGWIFEARLPNAGLADYHGYPVRPTEAIAEPVYRRFAAWAETRGETWDKKAAEACRELYGFRP